jgi:hypothetical protein
MNLLSVFEIYKTKLPKIYKIWLHKTWCCTNKWRIQSVCWIREISHAELASLQVNLWSFFWFFLEPRYQKEHVPISLTFGWVDGWMGAWMGGFSEWGLWHRMMFYSQTWQWERHWCMLLCFDYPTVWHALKKSPELKIALLILVLKGELDIDPLITSLRSFSSS